MKTTLYTKGIKLLKVTLKAIKILLIILLSYQALALHVDVIDNGDETSTLVITDDCEIKHELKLKKDEIGKGKELEFLKKLMSSGKYNKCVDN